MVDEDAIERETQQGDGAVHVICRRTVDSLIMHTHISFCLPYISILLVDHLVAHTCHYLSQRAMSHSCHKRVECENKE